MPINAAMNGCILNQKIADDAAAKCRGARQHQQSQQIQIPANGGHRSFNPKKEPARSTA
jgi:hypothetical protein